MVDVGAAFVADPEAFEGVQPRETPLDRPAHDAESGTVGDASTGDHRGDAADAQQTSVFVVVVAAIGIQVARPSPRSSRASANCGKRIDQGDELGDVVPVASGRRHGQWCAVGVR